MSSTTLCEKISQKVLSTKHEDGSSNVLDIELSEYERNYIRAVPNEHVLKLSERLAGKNVTLTIYAPEAAHLSDIKTIEDLSTVTLNRISELSSVQFTVERKDGVEVGNEVVVSMDRRKSSMSHHFLEYIKRVGWGLTPQGNFTIDLKDWDASLSMFELPLRHVNMLDFMKRIEAVIRSTGDSGKRIVRGQKTFKDFNNTKDALMELYTLVTDKIKVNVAHLAVIVKASQIRSSENLDFRIPLFGNKTEFGTYTDKMQFNSLGAQMGYQNHQRVISAVRSYIIRDRNDHPLDNLLSAVDEDQPEP
jgi:TATA-box binding protein (TBP) (component of TFIID and TFIIIB)